MKEAAKQRMAASAAPPAARDAAAPRVATAIGLVVVLVCVLTRALSRWTHLPGWDAWPLDTALPVQGFGPAFLMTLDGACLIGAALVVAGRGFRAGRVPWLSCVMVALGAVGVAWHTLGAGGHPQGLLIGSTWVAAVAAGVACFSAADDRRLQVLAAAVVLGAIAPLAVKGSLDVTVDHDATVAVFNADPEAALRAQGIEPGTRRADIFERRLRQREARAWFDISNILATPAAFASVTFLGLGFALFRAERAQRRGGDAQVVSAAMLGVGLGATAAWMTLILTGSKGGWAATAAGLLVLTFSLLWLRRVRDEAADLIASRLGTAIGLLVPIGVVIAVALRGAIGTGLGELSLLFRWFYIETAARVFAGTPLMGVGPGRFQSAYAAEKPAISPEDVSSPHSVVFDFAASLGVFGLALAAVFVGLCVAAGRSLLIGPARETVGRTPIWVLALIALLATLLPLLQTPGDLLAYDGLVRVIGLVGWIVIGAAVLSACTGPAAVDARPTLAAAALALAAHAMIELTPTYPNAAGLAFAMLGLAAGRRGPPRPPRSARTAAVLSSLTLLPIGLMTLLGARHIWRWEAPLREAHAVASAYAEEAQDSQRRSADARAVSALAAADRLSAATGWFPTTPRVHDLQARLYAEAARAASGEASVADARYALAVQAASDAAADHRQSGAALARLANLEAERAKAAAAPDEADAGALAPAIEGWRRSLDANPHFLEVATRLAVELDLLGDPRAAEVAREALAINERMRLDPLRQLPDRTMRRLERIAGPSD